MAKAMSWKIVTSVVIVTCNLAYAAPAHHSMNNDGIKDNVSVLQASSTTMAGDMGMQDNDNGYDHRIGIPRIENPIWRIEPISNSTSVVTSADGNYFWKYREGQLCKYTVFGLDDPVWCYDGFISDLQPPLTLHEKTSKLFVVEKLGTVSCIDAHRGNVLWVLPVILGERPTKIGSALVSPDGSTVHVPTNVNITTIIDTGRERLTHGVPNPCNNLKLVQSKDTGRYITCFNQDLSYAYGYTYDTNTWKLNKSEYMYSKVFGIEQHPTAPNKAVFAGIANGGLEFQVLDTTSTTDNLVKVSTGVAFAPSSLIMLGLVRHPNVDTKGSFMALVGNGRGVEAFDHTGNRVGSYLNEAKFGSKVTTLQACKGVKSERDNLCAWYADDQYQPAFQGIRCVDASTGSITDTFRTSPEVFPVRSIYGLAVANNTKGCVFIAATETTLNKYSLYAFSDTVL